MMVSRQFTTREKILLLIAGIVIVTAVYVKFVYMDVSSVMARYPSDLAEAQDELDMEQMKYTALESMKRELEEMEENGEALSEIPPYDNSKNVMDELNQILLLSESYTLSFLPLEKESATVRRKITLNFTAYDYATAERIVNLIHGFKYRCLITSLSFSSENTIKTGPVTVNIEATFFERDDSAPAVSDNKPDDSSQDNSAEDNEDDGKIFS